MWITTDLPGVWKTEERLVKYLLQYYGFSSLAVTKIEHIEKLQFGDEIHSRAKILDCPPPKERLTLRAWEIYLNRNYPIWLNFHKVTRRQELSMRKHLCHRLDKTMLYRHFLFWLQYDEPRPFCTIYHFPYQRSPGEYLVVHPLHYREHSLAGDGRRWKCPSGQTMVLQELKNFLRLVDRFHPPSDWQISAGVIGDLQSPD